MLFTEFLIRFPKFPHGGGEKWQAHCPAHDDKTPSLSITRENDKILLHCHAGCSAESIVAAMGLELKDLYINPPEPEPVMRVIEKEYIYTDANGKPLHKTIRYNPKDFRQCRPDPDNPGKWIPKIQGVETVLYNLPLINAAIKKHEPIFIVEGEKDADTFKELFKGKACATTNPSGGAGKWLDRYTESLKGAETVYIIPDNDEPGRKHAQDVARSLYGKVKNIKIADIVTVFPELPEHGDFTDFRNKFKGTGRLGELFKKLTETAVNYEPAPDDSEKVSTVSSVSTVSTVSSVSTLIINPLETISAIELSLKDIPPLKYIINGFLPYGLSLLCAPSKYGKSWLALNAALSAAYGEPFLNFTTEKRGVLYLALEDGHRRLKKRMNMILKGRKPPEGLDIAIKSAAIRGGLAEQINAYLNEKPATGLIIIDVLQKVRPPETKNGNIYAADYSTVNAIKTIADERDIAILVIHHTRKMKDAEDPYNMISGTTGLMGAADTIILIQKKTRDSKEAILSITGRDVESCDYEITFDAEKSFKWQYVGTAEEQRERRARDAYEDDAYVKTIKGLLEKSPVGIEMTASEFMQEMQEYSGLTATPIKIGMAFKCLAYNLYRFDKIKYKPPGSTKLKKHSFIKDDYQINFIQVDTVDTVDTTNPAALDTHGLEGGIDLKHENE